MKNVNNDVCNFSHPTLLIHARKNSQNEIYHWKNICRCRYNQIGDLQYALFALGYLDRTICDEQNFLL